MRRENWNYIYWNWIFSCLFDVDEFASRWDCSNIWKVSVFVFGLIGRKFMKVIKQIKIRFLFGMLDISNIHHINFVSNLRLKLWGKVRKVFVIVWIMNMKLKLVTNHHTRQLTIHEMGISFSDSTEFLIFIIRERINTQNLKMTKWINFMSFDSLSVLNVCGLWKIIFLFTFSASA